MDIMYSEILTDREHTVDYKVLIGSGQTVKCEVIKDIEEPVRCEVLTVMDKLYCVRY